MQRLTQVVARGREEPALRFARAAGLAECVLDGFLLHGQLFEQREVLGADCERLLELS